MNRLRAHLLVGGPIWRKVVDRIDEEVQHVDDAASDGDFRDGELARNESRIGDEILAVDHEEGGIGEIVAVG